MNSLARKSPLNVLQRVSAREHFTAAHVMSWLKRIRRARCDSTMQQTEIRYLSCKRASYIAMATLKDYASSRKHTNGSNITRGSFIFDIASLGQLFHNSAPLTLSA